MRENIVRTRTANGNPIEYIDKVCGSGTMKDVYFSPDGSYVVAFYKKTPDEASLARIKMLAGTYREQIFNQTGGDYWKNVFCWPVDWVETDGRTGIVMPTYAPHFFFEYGSKNNDFLGIKGKEKEGKWFASANNQFRFLDPRERGDWLSYLRIGLLISRAVRRLHAAGLAHSDLSYKNVLVDPAMGKACVIDLDGLVVPGKYPPDVVGTPDFIAPEVVKTASLDKTDPNRFLPSIHTDLHALAVLNYMYLFYRHPLRGAKVHDPEDEQHDEQLTMGEKALFIEHPSDTSNRLPHDNLKPHELPWLNTDKLPYKVAGPYLAPLFERAFIAGLHEPAQRPTANEWEDAFIRTVDLVQPCHSPECPAKWYVFDNTTRPVCPFCNTPYAGKLPVLNFYSSRQAGNYRPDNHRLMVWTGQSLFPWHINRLISPNEKLTEDEKKRVGYFVLQDDTWWLVNENIPGLYDVTNRRAVPIGDKVALQDNGQILFSKENGGRLAMIQLVEGS